MGMLDRYRKSGGFIQLLQLIEACAPGKKEKLLGMIDTEDKRWSNKIREKMLTIEDIFSWPEQQLAEIVIQIHEMTLAYVLLGMGEEAAQKALLTFSHAQKRRIADHTDSRNVGPGEIAAANSKFIEEVRKLVIAGAVRLKDFAPDKVVEENIEEKLSTMPAFDHFESNSSNNGGPGDMVFEVEPTIDSSKPMADTEAKQMIQKLQQQLQVARKENAALQKKLSAVEQKLAEIKRLAA